MSRRPVESTQCTIPEKVDQIRNRKKLGSRPGVYADRWVKERGHRLTTQELYRRLLRLHVRPTFGKWDLDEITPPRVRTWASG